MRPPTTWLALSLSLLFTPASMALSEFGIEGMGVVSTKANESQATISPDGQRIVWASDRPGGAGGWDLWQARLVDGRWQDPQPLGLNSARDERDPAYSPDGRWLYFAADRSGGRGGFDLYRAAVAADGSVGKPEPMAGLNTRDDERSPALRPDGLMLLFARNGKQGEGGFDLYRADVRADGFGLAQALPKPLNSAADELGATWLDNRGALAFTRAAEGKSQVWVVGCDYAQAAVPLVLSFNTADGQTDSPGVDWNKPGEMVLSGQARSPRAGGLDLYRLKKPVVDGGACGP
ncbi:TolB-like protein [Stenotrophomonas sp.]|uniref:TolB family protein n=1 Tax=Stenotrophomonas sp. TaxID=69392 RepID=UPI0028AC397F|nr:TolB-like protein [Stenotrophomonas sp.]